MAKTPTVEEAARRAEQALSQRVETVRALARARQALQDVADEGQRELDQLRQAIATRTRDAELTDARAWANALDAGWSAEELRRVGFPEPALKARARRTRTTGTATSPKNPARAANPASEGQAGAAGHTRGPDPTSRMPTPADHLSAPGTDTTTEPSTAPL